MENRFCHKPKLFCCIGTNFMSSVLDIIPYGSALFPNGTHATHQAVSLKQFNETKRDNRYICGGNMYTFGRQINFPQILFDEKRTILSK